MQSPLKMEENIIYILQIQPQPSKDNVPPEQPNRTTKNAENNYIQFVVTALTGPSPPSRLSTESCRLRVTLFGSASQPNCTKIAL